MRNKIKKIVSLILIGIMIGTIPAVADTIYWTGQGTDSVTTCTSGESPGLLWVFTTDHYTLGAPDPVLTIGTATYTGENKGNSNFGSWHFPTPYYDPSTLYDPITKQSLVHVNYSVADYGNGQLNLVISHGCSEIPEFPTVAMPVAAMIGLVFFFRHRRNKEE